MSEMCIRDSLGGFHPEAHVHCGIVRITGGDFAGQEGIFLKVKGARDRLSLINI